MRFRAIAAVSAVLLVLGPAAAAQATPTESSTTTWTTGLVSPLHLAVAPGKSVTVSEEFASKLTNVTKDGTKTTLYSAPGWDVAGGAYRGSTLYFVESQGAGPEDTRPLAGSLKAIDAQGNVTTITDQLGAYEEQFNPDQVNTYGLSAAEAAARPNCVAQMEAAGIPVNYTGEVDSHPYAVAVRGNVAYVADAGSNAIFSVNLHTGAISTLVVLPPRPVHISQEAADALGLSACGGVTYSFEFVPTDIEFGPDGMLYVSSLPGGPEDGSLGMNGAVFTVDPATGDTHMYVGGLLSPTGIALDGSGNLYIASLFGEGIFKVPAGSHEASLFMPAVMAADVEVSGSTLYATTNALENGTLVSMRL